jgi:multiple sugar transport system substrate-binding protein
MTDITRRDALKIGAGTAALAATGVDALAQGAPKWEVTPEKGASIRVLRGARFVQGDETVFNQNVAKYEKATGVKVKVDYEGWEDITPKAAVAANVGKGPDIVYGWYDIAHQYPDKLIDLSDVANYLGAKYGGWFDVCKKFGQTKGGRWVAIPLGAPGSKMVYRISHLKEAGYTEFPKDTKGFLALCQAMKKANKAVGLALGNAVGDANGWCHWVIWSHGGKMVNEKDQVVINSPETIAGLEYAKELYQTFVPGTLSWLDPSNNKAFLDDQLSLTTNGISIYYAAKNSTDPKIKAMAEDIGHADYPVGPIGRPTQLNLIVPAMVFRYSKFKNAAKDFIRFMMEQEQYEPWANASIGYFSHPLMAYDKLPIWTVDPKHTPYRDTMRTMLWPSYAGSLGYASAGALADFIMVQMVATACSGAKSPKDAAAEAQKRAERYYKV